MEDTEKNALLARIAALETEVAPLRARVSAPSDNTKQIKADFAHDPVAALRKYGVAQDYVTQVLVAAELERLGQPVPEQLRAARERGPAMAAQSAILDEVAALRQRLDAEAAERTRESTKTTFADKTKYPRLSAAYAADPTLFEEDVSAHKGNAAALADKLEKRLAATARALGVSEPSVASKESATGTANPSSKQGTASASGAPAGNPPPITMKTSKGFSDDDRQALRDEIVRNAERGVYDAPTHPYRPAD